MTRMSGSRTQLYIDGAWSEATSDETRPVINPATGKAIADMAIASTADVDRAVAAARAALETGPWSQMTGYARRGLLLAFARELRDAAASIGETATDDMGMPLMFTTASTIVAADYVEYFAGWADKIAGEVVPTPVPGALDYTIRHPVGVVAAIVPWNAPIYISISKLAPALAAGCTVVLKPSEEAPLAPLKLAECVERAGFPPGVVNVVTGLGPGVGAALVAHPGVDKVSFTGGTELGRVIGAEAARTFKRVALELGGKSANIVFADADLDAAAMGATMAVLMNTGQQCIAGSRLLVQRPVYEEVLGKVAAITGGWSVGDPRASTSQVGPLISERHLDRVVGYVGEAAASGRVVLGGERLGGDLADGFYVGPTLVADVDTTSALWREEVFGPVTVAVPFDTPAEAVALANDSDFGLAGGVWTHDLDTAHGVAGAMRTGTVWVNSYLAMFPSAPFGGHKESGVGREGGRVAVEEYTELTNVFLQLRPV